MTVQNWYYTWQVLLVISTISSGICTYGIFVTGREIEKRNEIQKAKLKEEIQIEKSKIRTLLVHLTITFKPLWENPDLWNGYSSLLKNGNFLVLIGETSDGELSQVDLPRYGKEGDLMTFDAHFSLMGRYPSNKDYEELRNIKSLRILLPFFSLNRNIEHKVLVESIKLSFSLNGQERESILFDAGETVSISKAPEDNTQGQAFLYPRFETNLYDLLVKNK
jgi:hypothetical protein